MTWWSKCLWIGGSGAAGALCRYGITALAGRIPRWHDWPLGTWTVNLLGSFALGWVLGGLEKGGALSPELRLILATGFLGSFTTFSTFMADSVRLQQDGGWLLLVLNIVPQILLGIMAFGLGHGFGRP